MNNLKLKELKKMIFWVSLVPLVFLISPQVNATNLISSNSSLETTVLDSSSNRALPAWKNVAFTVKFPKRTGRPPSQKYYNDGVYSGWVSLNNWEDLSDKYPSGYILGHYRGKVGRIAIPNSINVEK